ncbi:metal ABC transporter ATP-binding protein [Fluviispira sanaruensis]|uniref:Metal ABC transporter ATP-binding protein n=1 Tax=Fluviispira sanaruensis TaxID=2493639 RepID=A0A4P2VVA6_FLUSA|nr:ATP-binding cassette domain-containing protein [Fluviispira sanaruensis]BBH53455.1 metal ABC transporter ATP-binding protein [Fluviispira sanaruensis]
MSYLSWENLAVGYPNKHPLIHPFSGEVNQPGIYAVVGQNGCGKSTLLKTWLGLIKPLRGKVCINNMPIPNAHDISQGIAYVPQFHAVNRYFHLTVQDFVKQGFGPHHNLMESDIEKILNTLTEWQLAGYEKRSFHELSGGQKTRAMIARAIISKPKMLFLDEPLASLDSCCQLQLMDTLFELSKEKKVCIFMIDHHFENFESYISGKITFTRRHDQETSVVFI